MTEHERERGCAKSRRFYERHGPRYSGERLKRARRYRQAIKITSAKCCTFELADPRDDERKPLFIGVGYTLMVPVWAVYWSLRNVSHAPGLFGSMNLTPWD